jgi:NAD-dependent deacetylase sirtuin 4
MLLVGTSLATYSAYRLLKQAHDGKKGAAMLNVGTSRGDDLGESSPFIPFSDSNNSPLSVLHFNSVPSDLRFSLGSSDVLTRVALLLANGKERQDALLDNLLRSGVMETVIDKPSPETAGNAVQQHVVNPQ